MLALFLFSFQLGRFPLRHAYSDTLVPAWSGEFAGSVLYQLVLPATTIVGVSLGNWLLGSCNSMIGVLAEDSIALAEAKRLPERQVDVACYFLACFGGHRLTITAFIVLLATISGVKSLPSNLLAVADLVESNKT